jgi:hypothetical protein
MCLLLLVHQSQQVSATCKLKGEKPAIGPIMATVGLEGSMTPDISLFCDSDFFLAQLLIKLITAYTLGI